MTSTVGSILVIDDEPYNLEWLFEHFEDLGFKVAHAQNANQAYDILGGKVFRILIIDLNIPVMEPLRQTVRGKGVPYSQFPGLLLAEHARTLGYRDRQVIIYSVHKEASVAELADQIRCTYILKGSPRQMIREIEEVLSFDPSAG